MRYDYRGVSKDYNYQIVDYPEISEYFMEVSL